VFIVPPVIVPVVIKFSSPNDISPPEALMVRFPEESTAKVE